MAWQNDMVIVLRALINDLDGSDYTSEKLEQILVVSAHLIRNEIDFINLYTVDVEAISITPDPLDSQDYGFINLTCLKAACLILAAEVKIAAAQSFRVQDAGAVVDVKGVFEAKKVLYDQLYNDFIRAKTNYVSGNLNAFAAILTPITQDSNDTQIILG